ncbi:hypothetical protein HDU89_000340 [Geranomyces variabilis]|nr:hypothetical protein HDU89_000340 [Geranomyces variabilis]
MMTERPGLDPETRDFNAIITTISHRIPRTPSAADASTVWYEHMVSLRKLLALVTQPKQIYSAADLKCKCVTGPGLLLMAESYIKAFNDKAIPTISNAWDSVCESARSKAMQAMVQQYNDAMNAPFALHDTLPEQEIFENHCKAQAAAVRGFVDAVLDKDAQNFIDELKNHLARFDGTKVVGGEYLSYVNRNMIKSQKVCEALRNGLHEELKRKAKEKSFKTFSEYEAACRGALEQFDTEARGPAARVVRCDFAEALNRGCEPFWHGYQLCTVILEKGAARPGEPCLRVRPCQYHG